MLNKDLLYTCVATGMKARGMVGSTYPDLGPLASTEGAVRALEGSRPSMGSLVTLHLCAAREGF